MINISLLLTLVNQIKIFHWQTPKYAEHIALNDLYDALNDQIDELVEVYQGKIQSVIKTKDNFDVKLYNYISTEDIVDYIDKFINYLDTKMIDKPDENGDLVSIKDDIVAGLNKTKYLLTLE